MRRFLVMTVIVMAAVIAFSPNAAATTQTVIKFDFTSAFTLPGICSFPLSVTSHYTGTRIRFFDDSGELFKAEYQITEQDTLSANGKSVTSDSYSYNLMVSYQNGVVTAQVANGVAEKIVLPDGTLFLSAGVIDFIAQGVDASLMPDPGLTGDIDALCAALSA